MAHGIQVIVLAPRPTSVVNQIRAFLLERSIRFSHRAGPFASAHAGPAGGHEPEADGTPTPKT